MIFNFYITVLAYHLEPIFEALKRAPDPSQLGLRDFSPT